MRTLNALLISMRPKQWVKNLIIFGPLIFSRGLFQPRQLLLASLAFGAFCLLAGSVYLLNDLFDIEKDRQHPTKRLRPLPSGQIGVGLAVAALLAGALVALVGSFWISTDLGLFGLTYFLLNVLYSTRLKHVVIVDVMTIALGFVLRVLAGAAAIAVPTTPWLLMCTILLALFLGFAKRRHELTLLTENAESHRKVLTHYSPYLLDQMILIVSSATVMSYALYTISPETVAHFGTDKLIYTVPFVLYGLFRYLYLVHQREEGGSPTRVLFTDKPLILNILAWLIACVWIIEGGA